MPPSGYCAGPIERAVVRFQYVTSLNEGCNINQVVYYVDGLEENSNKKCGECIPGTDGVTDALKLCGVNEYCDDNAKCQPLASQPLFGADCPYEAASNDLVSWCGPGLHCFNHVCLPCENGVIDPSDGKVCYNNLWTYSKWQIIFTDPSSTFLGVFCGLLFVQLIIPFLACVTKKCRRTKMETDKKETKKSDKKRREDAYVTKKGKNETKVKAWTKKSKHDSGSEEETGPEVDTETATEAATMTATMTELSSDSEQSDELSEESPPPSPQVSTKSPKRGRVASHVEISIEGSQDDHKVTDDDGQGTLSRKWSKAAGGGSGSGSASKSVSFKDSRRRER